VTIRFGPFALEPAARLLRRDGADLHLTPKAFDLLVALVEARPNVLSKTALQQRLWPDAFVAEANLSNLISEVREALGARAGLPVFIRTAHAHGYAFCGVCTVEGGDDAAGQAPGCWFEWGHRKFRLNEGTHVIGRDADVRIRLDAPTVSRRHARVHVTRETARIEDLDSKNGTFVGGARVSAPQPLVDGDLVGIGSLLVTFRAGPLLGSTETLLGRTR
jgi:DNA-binding winged helix-turn-helix (wHTH) protein